MVVRTNTGLQFQFADHHGTGAVAVDPASGAITHRRTDPFGNPRGQQPTVGVWSGEKGFVGGNQDTSTGLTQLGARLYDPVNGRFISPDPLIDPNDPQQMNAYAYSNNSPVTFTDPTGLMYPKGDEFGGGGKLRTGAIGACAETVLNIAGSFVGGMVAKIARKYGAPWKWKKAAELGRRLVDLGGQLVSGVQTWMKETKLVSLSRRTASTASSPGRWC